MTRTSVKVLTLVTCLSALSLTVGVMGCASDRSNQSTEPRVEDRRTAERVREALAASSEYKFDGIRVAAGNGFVQLSGIVNTSDQRHRAGEVASKVVGVKNVENILTGRY